MNHKNRPSKRLKKSHKEWMTRNENTFISLKEYARLWRSNRNLNGGQDTRAIAEAWLDAK
jgi:hypothetical protein